MDLKKTGRLIRRRRTKMGLTLEQLAEQLHFTSQAVSNWENGKRYPGSEAQVMIYDVMGLNPVELLTGLEMYEEDTKKAIASYMKRIDEEVFTGGNITDENGIESYMDMSEYVILSSDGNGEPIPYLDYYNAEPHILTEREQELKDKEDAVPRVDYNPTRAYINCGPAIFIIPVEILKAIGSPTHFEVCWNHKAGWAGLEFVDEGSFDIPDEVYESKGLRVIGGDFGSQLCKEMGISEIFDQVAVAPFYVEEKILLVMDLNEAQRIHMQLFLNEFALPTWQREEEERIEAMEELELEMAEL